jgi:hypothetical protein
MKRISSIAFAFVLVSSLGAFAADKSAEKPKDSRQTKVNKSAKTSQKPEKAARQVALTGSYIKRDINRSGVVTDGSNPVVVLDSEAIKNSGAGDLRELLLFRGISR